MTIVKVCADQYRRRAEGKQWRICNQRTELCEVTRLLFIFSRQEKEKDKEKTKEKDKDSKEKEKDKKLLNGHLFTATSVVAQATCYHCMKPFNKDSYYCASKCLGFFPPLPFVFH